MPEKKRILLVEDDVQLGREWQYFFTQEGSFAMDWATTDREARGFIEQREYAIYLLDLFHLENGIYHPDGGLNLIRALRSKYGKSKPIIVVTGYGNHTFLGDMRSTAQMLGANKVIEKPIDAEELLAEMKKRI